MQLKRRIKNIGKKTSEILEREFKEWFETLTPEEWERWYKNWLSKLAKDKVFTASEITAIKDGQMTDEEINRRINEHYSQNQKT